MIRKRPEIRKELCVGCGCCMRACPQKAVRVLFGICADIDYDKCIGCGICAGRCPADVISMKILEAAG